MKKATLLALLLAAVQVLAGCARGTVTANLVPPLVGAQAPATVSLPASDPNRGARVDQAIDSLAGAPLTENFTFANGDASQ